MAVPKKPHNFIIGATDFTGLAEPYTPKADETLPEEALAVKSYWRLFVDAPHVEIVQDAEVSDITLINGSVVLEAGPIYIRQINPYIAGLSVDHVEIIAVAYREEA
jgi:hypothetical protein